MPTDKRLYMTFPIDFHRHPKLRNQPPEVKWAFVEMNGEARLADNDGRFPAEDAEFLWSREILDALVSTHPTRPLVWRDENGGDYVIRDYAEHQETRAARAARAEKNRANGTKGGRPRRNPDLTHSKPSGLPVGTGLQANGTQHKAESESESEDLTKTSESSPVVDARASTDSKLPPAVQALASRAGITSVDAVVESLRKHTGRELTPDRAVGVSLWLLGKAKNPRAPQRYVTGAISRSPLEVQKYIDEAGLAS